MTENEENSIFRKITERLVGSITINIGDVVATDENALKGIYELMKDAMVVITTGKGRSGLALKFSTQRFNQLFLALEDMGKTMPRIWFIDDSTVPPISSKKCVVLMLSGSGETTSQRVLADEAKAFGAKLIVITSFPDSYIGKKADLVIFVRGRNIEESESTLPQGTKFELTALLALEALIAYIIETENIPPEKVKEMHRDLE